MDRFDRNIRFFGKEGQEEIRQTHLCIVGGGGLGQHVIQQAACLGFGEITVIDDEELSTTNRNRYVLAAHEDPIPGTRKVDIAERAIKLIDPKIKVHPIHASLRSAKAFDAMQSAGILVGCLDNDGARLVLTEYSLAYRKIYFDLASDISAEEGLRYGGRVLFTGNDPGCPVCMGEIDLDQARKDLESDASRRDREALYGVPHSDLDEGGPSVVSINGAVASLAMTEIIACITGLRKPQRFINYRGQLAQVTCSKDLPDPTCYYCNAIKGAGIAANVERYIEPRN